MVLEFLVEGEAQEIDFTPPFRRLRMFPDLEAALGCSLPAPDSLHTEEARLHLDRICQQKQVTLLTFYRISQT